MAMCRRSTSFLFLLTVACLLPQFNALRFQVEVRECIGYNVTSWGDIIHGSYVVVDSSSEDDWSMDWDLLNAMDITVDDPHNNIVYSMQNQVHQNFEFYSNHPGYYTFCLTNRHHSIQTVDLEVAIGHYPEHDWEVEAGAATDEHISSAQVKFYSLMYRQHMISNQIKYFHSLEEYHTKWDKAMSRYFTIKVTVQAMSLLACAILQVYLLRNLFEKKFARSFV